ncbi:MAG TPA: cytochrome c [Anaeromyxobacter sp.]|nr:cytochrome c [Anaeromyxobacter sp.]
MKRIVVVLAFALAATAARAEDAAALFQSKCKVCHGADGKGTPAGLKMGAKDLTTLKITEEEMVKDITNGEGKMLGFKGKLTDDQIKAVVKYVKSLK